MTPDEQKYFDAIHHVVHEYANFVSSAEMTLTGLDIYGKPFEPPINTHVSHAFYLNCRKQADFFQNRLGPEKDDVIVKHYAPGFLAALLESDNWRGPLNKQLAHTTHARDTNPREIKEATQRALFHELQQAWRDFRKVLPEPYGSELTRKVKEKKEPYPDGKLSEFRFYNLD